MKPSFTNDYKLTKLLLFVLIIFSSSNFCQRSKPDLNFGSQIITSNVLTVSYIFPFDDSIRVIFCYKVPVKKLIFTKNVDSFSAQLEVLLEVKDTLSNIERYFNNHKINYTSFEETINHSNFIEGVISFKHRKENLLLVSTFYDINSNKAIAVEEENVKIIDSSKFLYPIILNQELVGCDNLLGEQVTNIGGMIPYDNNSYNILFPITDLSEEKLFIKVISKKDTIFDGYVLKDTISFLQFNVCDHKIIMSYSGKNIPTNNFYLKGLTKKFQEGFVEIIVSDQDNFSDKKVFRLGVKWLNKPKSLLDSENAIKLLGYIINEDSVKHLLSQSKNYDSILISYWKPFDPSPESEYNELMAEFYQRVDFANEQFSTISGLKGLESDRGKIYVRFGKPNLVKRIPGSGKRILEIWEYHRLNKNFVFVDERGTGDYILNGTK